VKRRERERERKRKKELISKTIIKIETKKGDKKETINSMLNCNHH
jgi:hypothetical protein